MPLLWRSIESLLHRWAVSWVAAASVGCIMSSCGIGGLCHESLRHRWAVSWVSAASVGCIMSRCGGLYHQSLGWAVSRVAAVGCIMNRCSGLYHKSLQWAVSRVAAVGCIISRCSGLYHESLRWAVLWSFHINKDAKVGGIGIYRLETTVL